MTEPSNVRLSTPDEINMAPLVEDNNKAIEILKEADRNLKAIRFISKEMALEFTTAAMTALRMALEVDLIEKAKDDMDRIEAMRKYVRTKWQEGNSNILAYNTIAAVKIQTCQLLGDWLEKHYPANNIPGTGINQYTKEAVPVNGTASESDGVIGMTKQKDLGLGIGHTTLAAWRLASRTLGESELDEWLEPYKSGTDKEGNPMPHDQVPELTFSVFQEYLRSKLKKATKDLENKEPKRAEITLVMQSVFDDAENLSFDMTEAVQEIANGQIPDEQIKKVSDRLVRLVNIEIPKYLKYADLGNKVQPWEKKNCGGIK